MRWAVWPRAVFGGGGLGVSLTHVPSRIHFDFIGDVRGATLGAPRVVLANPGGAAMYPFARLRPRFAVGLPAGLVEVVTDIALLATPRSGNPIRLDTAVLAPWVRVHGTVEGTPKKGLRLSVQGGVESIGQDTSRAVTTPYFMGGGRGRVTYATWMGSGLPIPREQDFVVGDPEGPAPLHPRLAPLLLLFADANPTGGVFLDAWVDGHGGQVGGSPFATLAAGTWPVVPRARAEIVASAPLPLPIPAPIPVLGALEFQGVVGVVASNAPDALELPYPGSLTRDGRVFRGETLLKARFALRMPIAPPPPPAPNFLIFGIPTLQIDLGFGDVWAHAFDAASNSFERQLPGRDQGLTAEVAGEVGLEFRLPMAWANIGWTLWVRGEVGIRGGAAGLPLGEDPAPWLGERGVTPPVGFALGLGVPVR